MHAAQQYAAALPCPPEYYPASSVASSSNASVNNPYLAQDDGHAQNFASSFSTGSTFAYPHQDYRYLLDRGDGAYELCTPRLVDSGLDATGLGFTGNHHSASSSSAFEPQPEEITVYQHQQPTASWGWMDPTGPAAAPDHEIVAPAPIYPAGSAEAQYFGAGVCQAQTHENADADATGNSAHPQVHIHGNQEVQQQQPLVAVHSAAPLPIQQTPVGATQLPTPAAMAVLLSPREGRSAREPAQTGYGIIPPPSSASRRSIGGHRLSGSTSNIAPSITSGDSAAVVRNATHPGTAAAATRASRAAEAHPVVATQQVVPMIPDSIIREKKHACTMCHKRFDRPSTLRKHLLVHTGEKAFVCDTCGRRFGVASNLNRHVKRCILKPVNSPPLPSSKTPHDATEATALTSSITGPSIHMSSTNRMSASARRARGPSSSNSPASSSASGDFNSTSSSTLSTLSSSSTLSSPSSSTRGRDSANLTSTSITNSANRPPGQKRRRRAPSPSQWVPHTLQNFNLQSEDFYSICPQLLPVVYDPPREERNNFDENISPTPYHPSGWNGVLPGPGSPHCGLGGKDVRNYGFGGGRGEYMVGRIQLVC